MSNKKLLNDLSMKRIRHLQYKAVKNGDVDFFSDEEFDRLRDIYHGNYPALIFIKYIRPHKFQIGQCFERSLVISSIFDDAKLVRGNRKDYEISFGKGSWHWWVEHDGWCYDPATLLKTKKETYYNIYEPKELIELSKDEILQNAYYKSMVNIAPVNNMLQADLIALYNIADISNDEELKRETALFFNKINYTDANGYDMEKVYDTVEKMKEKELKIS